MKRFYKTTVLVSLLGVGISNFSYGASRGAGAMRGTEGIGGTSFGGSDMIERRGVFDALPALGQRTVAINPRLRAAIERGDSNEVRRLHRDKANRNARTENGFTPLHLAARCGHVEIVRLLTRGANRNARDENGFTPLHWAAMNGHVDVVSALLGAEANIEVPDNAGHTPLHIAAINGRIGIVRELLRTVAGRPAANIEARDNVGHTPLHYAAAGGHVELVRLLLENGANKEEPCSLIDFYNFGPLRCRAFKGRKVKCEHS